MDPIKLTRRLVDIESISGNEGAVGAELYEELCRLGYTTHKLAVAHERFNVLATIDEAPPQIIFSTHSLASGASLNEFHCIVARGILPQFSKSLQYRVHNLFLQSLARFGFVCLSSAESLHATPHEGAFRKVDEVFPIYRRMR